jgi:hypothetical protein
LRSIGLSSTSGRIKFSGDPIDLGNKTPVLATTHREVVTPWWNDLKRYIEARQ